MKSKEAVRFILEVIKPFKFWMALQSIAGIIWAIDLSARPYILKIIVDKIPSISPSNSVKELAGPVILYLLISLLVIILFRLFDYSWLKLNSPLKRHISITLMDKMMLLSHRVFQDNLSGSMANKVNDVMDCVPELLRIIIDKFFNHFLAASIAIATLYIVDYKFALILTVWLSVFVVITISFSKSIKKLCSSAAQSRSIVVGRIVDILSNVISVQLFSATKYESDNIRKDLNDYVIADQCRDWKFLWMFGCQGISFIIYQALCLALLINGFKEGYISSGDFVLILNINISVIGMLLSFGSEILKCYDLSGKINSGLKIALSTPEITNKPKSIDLALRDGAIVFDRVRFQYEKDRVIFDDKSITIYKGQKVGLVGYSGGGKSTFINLLTRIYDVTSGCISIGGQDIRNVTLESLRANITVIPQDPILFHRSLLDNISYGVDASYDEVVEASKKAYAHDFIMALPQQYDSIVGDRGLKLSGGQRQRIAIARAILKDAPILILDEATSQLDSITEKCIQKSLIELMKSKTTIVVAHRLSTLLSMDRILVFQNGEIIEDGTHAYLLSRGGVYNSLWSTQVGSTANTQYFNKKNENDLSIV